MAILQEMLERDNVLVGMFKQLRECFTGVQPEPVGLRLLERRITNGSLENLPTENDYEFVGLVVDNDFVNCRDVVAKHKKKASSILVSFIRHTCHYNTLYYSYMGSTNIEPILNTAMQTIPRPKGMIQLVCVNIMHFGHTIKLVRGILYCSEDGYSNSS